MIETIFENADYIVLNKPSGVLTVPARFADKDPRPVLGRILETHLNIQIFPVHRLDFEVSGLVMFAKNAKAHSQANQWFENKRVIKTYSALTTGPSLDHIPQVYRPNWDVVEPSINRALEWKSKILKGKKRSYYSEQGKPSITRARCVKSLSECWQWELQPVTGRSHQLRLELSQHGFPILGDELYGSPVKFSEGAIALKAFKLEFLDQQLPTIELPLL
ncbi:MAG: RluA family pseudouridine synthase [Bdellovibrionia bacterium]